MVAGPRRVGNLLRGLRGDIETVSLVSVLQIIEMEHKSGVLVARRGESLAALGFNRGVLDLAQVEEARVYRGEEALAQLLTWQQGVYLFSPRRALRVAAPLQQRLTPLLMRAMQTQDEANEARLR